MKTLFIITLLAATINVAANHKERQESTNQAPPAYMTDYHCQSVEGIRNMYRDNLDQSLIDAICNMD